MDLTAIRLVSLKWRSNKLTKRQIHQRDNEKMDTYARYVCNSYFSETFAQVLISAPILGLDAGK